MTKYLLPRPVPLKSPHSPFRNFNYMRPIYIKGSSEDLRDYQVKINLNKNNFPLEKCKLDGSDIRFRDSTGEALSFWIESWNESEAIVWCKVPFIPADGFTDIWIIFGNPNAVSASDSEATFEYFNDFEELNFDNEAEGSFKIVDGTYLDTDGIGSGSEWHGPRGSADLSTSLSNFIVEAKIKQTVSSSGEERHAIYLCDGSGNIIYYFYLGDNWATSSYSGTELFEGGGTNYEENVPTGSTLLYKSGFTTTWNNGEWVFKLSRIGSNLDFSYDNTSLWTGSTGLTTDVEMIKWAIMGYGTYSEITTHMFNYVLVRKFASPEPIAIL